MGITIGQEVLGELSIGATRRRSIRARQASDVHGAIAGARATALCEPSPGPLRDWAFQLSKARLVSSCRRRVAD
jgi:hypothetical protein